MRNKKRSPSARRLHEAAWPDMFANLHSAYAELTQAQFELERRAAEIQDTRDLFQQAIESMSEALFLIDRSGRLIRTNPAAGALLGCDEATLVGQLFSEICGDAEIPATAWQLLKRAPQGTLTNQEIQIQSWLGDTISVGFSAGLVRDKRGKITGVLVVAQDITERKRAEQERGELLVREQGARAEAEEARRRFAFLAEASKRLGESLDYETTFKNVARLAVPELADWCIVDVIEEDGSICRLEVSQELRRHLLDMTVKTHPLSKVLRTGQPEIISEIPDSLLSVASQEGEPPDRLAERVPRSYLSAPLLARERRLGALTFLSATPNRYSQADIALVEDLARRCAFAVDNARLYRKAQEANRLKDEFLATVSHELRTPLTAILGWARMLRTGGLGAATQARALETIERNAKSQAQLIEDLLDISRIITGKLRLDVRPIELAKVIEAAVDAVRPAAQAKSIRLQVMLDPKVGSVSGDPERLQQVVWNLLSNAIKFTPQGGHVQIRLERIDSHAQTTVTDTGQGIPTDFLPYVFDRFRQADGTISRSHGGLGLGLAIVRQLVELHGGTVHAESPGEGLGATFTVRLPLRVVHEDPEDRRHPPPVSAHPVPFDRHASLEGLTVLVVDDEADARELITQVLEQCGANVTAVASAAEAFDALISLKPDVLVSDIGMSGEDGYALIRKVRALPPHLGGNIPAIALTAYARVEDRMSVLSSGYQMHVPKPIEPAELVLIAASLVGRTGKTPPSGERSNEQ